MRVKKISIENLFGFFNCTIPLNIDERITIIHGVNGCGKTTILRALTRFLEPRGLLDLFGIPIEAITLELDNGDRISAQITYTEGKISRIVFNLIDRRVEVRFSPNRIDWHPNDEPKSFKGVRDSVNIVPLNPDWDYPLNNTIHQGDANVCELEAESPRFKLFKELVDRRFSCTGKTVEFGQSEDIFEFKSPQGIALNNLSSGESKLASLYHLLLFKAKPGSLVLIDEPEASLHVEWQTQFLKDLKKIIELTDIDILIATNSPDIIQNQWDLTVELNIGDTLARLAAAQK
jgi:predicted ATP-dependent endonuclease of OLD family